MTTTATAPSAATPTAADQPALAAALDRPYPLTDDQKRRFREDGFIKLKDVFTPDVLDFYGAEITRVVFEDASGRQQASLSLEQRSTYGKAFIQVVNLWEKSARARAFSFSKRLARLAAELMGVAGVRMYHDQALYKEAGGGFTPWHVDQYYWPLETGKCVTAWVPLQAVPIDMGPLCFGRGSHIKNIARDIAISDESERQIREAIRADGLIEVFEPYDLGEVSFHLGWTLHRAGPNTSGQPRKVHTVIYMDQDMRLVAPKRKEHEADHRNFAPTAKVGQVIDDPKTPVLWTSRAPGGGCACGTGGACCSA